MSRLSKLKILFLVEVVTLFLQFYSLIYIKNNIVLSNFLALALCGVIATIGLTFITGLYIKWGYADLKLNK